MPNTTPSFSQLPSEYLLPHVTPDTIKQSPTDNTTYDATLTELTNTNTDLIAWVRTETSRQFPDDLNARRRAFGITISALGIVSQQTLKNAVVERFQDTVLTNIKIPPAA